MPIHFVNIQPAQRTLHFINSAKNDQALVTIKPGGNIGFPKNAIPFIDIGKTKSPIAKTILRALW